MFYFFSHPQSLHYLSPDGANQYTQAIQSVGEIIEPYDTDKQFPALGFGAKVPPHGQVSFEFFLNLIENPYCNGVQGILQAYKNALTQVCLFYMIFPFLTASLLCGSSRYFVVVSKHL